MNMALTISSSSLSLPLLREALSLTAATESIGILDLQMRFSHVVTFRSGRTAWADDMIAGGVATMTGCFPRLSVCELRGLFTLGNRRQEEKGSPRAQNGSRPAGLPRWHQFPRR
jgi:hypothetical protein